MDQQLEHEACTVLEYVEDTVEHICDTELLSGEKVWTMIQSLAQYKLTEFPVDEYLTTEDDDIDYLLEEED
tara:strand:- start:680 stop:892 length:213 start_codon:yes stop_codon:yes gene_type:complete